ncbi:MAG: hypothetical protein AAF561_17135 [Planctomycetota bacterium]
MTPGEFRDYLRAEPFIPFRLFTADGMSYDVKSPLHAIPSKYALALGVDFDDEGVPQRVVYVDPHLVSRVEFDLSGQKPGGGERA